MRFATGRFYPCPFCGGIPAYVCDATRENRMKYYKELADGEVYNPARVIPIGYDGVRGVYTSIEEDSNRFIVEKNTYNDGAKTTIERRAFDKCKVRRVNNNLIMPSNMRGRPLALPRYRREE